MRSRWNPTIVLVYIAACLGVLGYIVAQMGLVYPWQHPYALTVNFTTADGILSNNEVFMNGTKVGHVGTVSTRDGTAWVQLVLDDSSALPVYKDATAEVRKKNLLGETYVDLQRGTSSATAMADGDTIPVNHTVQITQIDQVLGILDPNTLQRVQLLINALGQGTSGRGSDLNAQAASAKQLVTALDTPAVELSVRRQQLDDIVLELQRFQDMLANQRGQVRDEFVTWNQVMGELANQEQALGGTVRQADTLLASLNTLVNGQGSNIQATLAGLPATLTSLQAFLKPTNDIFTALAPVRGAVHDIFPHLATSFADTDANGQHFWSVYTVGCSLGCGNAAGDIVNGQATPSLAMSIGDAP